MSEISTGTGRVKPSVALRAVVATTSQAMATNRSSALIPMRGIYRERGCNINARRRLTGLYRRILARPPFGPRAVVERGALYAEDVERQRQCGRIHAGAAACHDRLCKIDTAGRERCPECRVVLQPPIGDDVGRGHVKAAGNASRLHPSTRLRRLSAEARRRPRIDELEHVA